MEFTTEKLFLWMVGRFFCLGTEAVVWSGHFRDNTQKQIEALGIPCSRVIGKQAFSLDSISMVDKPSSLELIPFLSVQSEVV